MIFCGRSETVSTEYGVKIRQTTKVHELMRRQYRLGYAPVYAAKCIGYCEIRLRDVVPAMPEARLMVRTATGKHRCLPQPLTFSICDGRDGLRIQVSH